MVHAGTKHLCARRRIYSFYVFHGTELGVAADMSSLGVGAGAGVCISSMTNGPGELGTGESVPSVKRIKINIGRRTTYQQENLPKPYK